MAKNKSNRVQRQGRRVIPAIRRSGARAKKVVGQVQMTLGDLIAAAMDAAHGSVDEAKKVLGSSEIAAATGRRIVVV